MELQSKWSERELKAADELQELLVSAGVYDERKFLIELAVEEIRRLRAMVIKA